jgi:predicted NAD-dependent protein-ADP-ribosyltransferase YbiA (DUF1768 family)
MKADTFIIISEKSLRKFIKATAQLDLLEEQGVDNWQGYGENFDELDERQQAYLDGFGLKVKD